MVNTVCKVLFVLAVYLRLGTTSGVYLQCKDTDYQPICASNNRTFPNECFLHVYNLYGDGSNVTKVTDGPCNGDGKTNEEETAHDNPEMNQPPMEHEIYDAPDIEDPESLAGTPDVVLGVDPKGYISKGQTSVQPPPTQNYVSAAPLLPPGDTPAHPPTTIKYVPAVPSLPPGDIPASPPTEGKYVPAVPLLTAGDTPAHLPIKNKYVPTSSAQTPTPRPSYPTAQTSVPPGDVPEHQPSTAVTEYPKPSYA